MPESVVRKKAAKSATKITQKVATKKAASKTVRKNSSRTQSRKAPTAIAQTNSDMAYTRKLLIIASGTFLIFVAVSVVIGFTDSGGIVVSDEFNKRIESATEEEREEIIKVSKPSPTADLPLGGLVGAGKSDQPPAPKEEDTSTSTASSTEESLDSTDAPEETDESVSTEDAAESDITEETDITTTEESVEEVTEETVDPESS